MLNMHLNGSLLIHERKDRKMEPFYWILTFEVMAFLIVLAVALVVGPVLLIMNDQAWWGYALLVAGGVLAALLVRFTFRYLAKLIRKNRRLNLYRIYEDRIEYAAYDAERLNRREDRFPLERAESVCASLYVAQQSYHYKKTEWTERVPAYELLPVLYIVYHGEGGRSVLAVPFYGDNAVDRWLGTLQQRGIPIRATEELLLPRPEADWLSVLDNGELTVPFAYDGNFRLDFGRFMHEAQSRTPKEDSPAGMEDTEAGGFGKRAVPIGMEPVPGGSGARWLRYPSYVVVVLLIASLYPIVLLEETGMIPGIGTVLCFVVLFVAALAFFYRMRRLTVWAPILFVLVACLGWFIFGASLESRGDIAYEVTSAAAGAAILQPALVWLPYGAAVWIRRRWPAAYHLRRIKPSAKAAGSEGKGERA
ncbi:hypothetical protein [Paenibacillus sp. DYY-L-2]|uniref:hypothetical protein n=1 Tax=Paenibacillus sp. DYY-L-2 TaxID=3447013 RepID=UPI003F507541